MPTWSFNPFHGETKTFNAIMEKAEALKIARAEELKNEGKTYEKTVKIINQEFDSKEGWVTEACKEINAFVGMSSEEAKKL